MTIGLVGRKVGMMRIFTDEGDAYGAGRAAVGAAGGSRVRKPLAGHLAKAGVEAGHVLREFRAKADELASLKVGGKIGVEIFKIGQKVDGQGTTLGKGFAGVIK